MGPAPFVSWLSKEIVRGSKCLDVTYILKTKMLRIIWERHVCYSKSQRKWGHTPSFQGTSPFISEIARIKFNIQSVALKLNMT